jgi:mono/diheme cytochrome c family protein
MREKLAIAVCVLALVVVVALSFVFAVRHNPETAAASPISAGSLPEPAPTDPAESNQVVAATDPSPVAVNPDLERGRTIYVQQGCATCHAIAGSGNPRHPLDGTGDRWTTDELPHWILGTGVAADELSTAVRRRKQRYQNLSPEDLNALVTYLSSLKEAKE